jgi:hypothetical protein
MHFTKFVFYKSKVLGGTFLHSISTGKVTRTVIKVLRMMGYHHLLTARAVHELPSQHRELSKITRQHKRCRISI